MQIEDDNQNGYFIHDVEDSMAFYTAQECFDFVQDHANLINKSITVEVNINPHNINFALNTKL